MLHWIIVSLSKILSIGISWALNVGLLTGCQWAVVNGEYCNGYLMANSKACTCIFYHFVIFRARLPGTMYPTASSTRELRASFASFSFCALFSMLSTKAETDWPMATE